MLFTHVHKKLIRIQLILISSVLSKSDFYSHDSEVSSSSLTTNFCFVTSTYRIHVNILYYDQLYSKSWVYCLVLRLFVINWNVPDMCILGFKLLCVKQNLNFEAQLYQNGENFALGARISTLSTLLPMRMHISSCGWENLENFYLHACHVWHPPFASM